MSDYSQARDQLLSLAPFQAEVVEILPDGRVKCKVGGQKPFVIPAPFYGGVRDSGMFRHPDIGDVLLCSRVFPGSQGVTQAIAVLASSNKSTRYSDNAPDVAIGGASSYPKVRQGDLKLLSNGGSEISLEGEPGNSQVHVTTSERSGLFINSDIKSTITTVSNIAQGITSASRCIAGDIIRSPGGGSSGTPIGHELVGYTSLWGERRGLYRGASAQDTCFLGAPRNPALSEWRLVINEFSEDTAYTGFDQEYAVSMSEDPKEYMSESHISSLDPRTSLSLAPHQLVEYIIGNVVNENDEVLDINYGTVNLGDKKDRPVIDEMAYERDRLISRRGIGYHFQLSTNSKSSEKSILKDNFICAIDKEGLLKINVPRGSDTGNVLFPAKAEFDYEGEGGVLTEPRAPSVEEKIPVTLRDKAGDVILPKMTAEADQKGKGTRKTGVRFSNNSGYFQNFANASDGGGSNKVRVNFTAHHNMYAAAEMLIANTIHKVLVPSKNSQCVSGIVTGHPTGEPFERYLGKLDADGRLEDNSLTFMSSVAILPGQPAIYPGGDTIVAGQVAAAGLVKGENKPYTNSFTVTGKPGKFTSTTTDGGSSGPKKPGGKSANINFEGAVDMSVGRDNYDKKSLVLDTAGSVVAWFGRDQAGRSLVLQTDGDIAVNVGGYAMSNGETSWKEGRFDLRVNVTNKGPVAEKKTWATEGGAQASDYIISISKEGLVIAGMNPGTPMVVRNDGPLSLESTAKLILQGSQVEVREGNTAAKKTSKADTSKQQPEPTPEMVAQQITCVTDILTKMTEKG
jgi:hypothetical protein